MINRLLQAAVKRFGLDKYVANVEVIEFNTPTTKDFVLKVNKTNYAIAFDVAAEYKDELALLINLLS